MGLDIRISRAKPIYCPHCGELVTYKSVEDIDSSGRIWYEFLDNIGYRKSGNSDMYGRDMVLDDESLNALVSFINHYSEDGFRFSSVAYLIENARIDGDKIVINANW